MKTKVFVASRNPVKLSAAEQGFVRMFRDTEFEFIGVSVPSGVSEQPTSDAETLKGAQNRCRNLSELKNEKAYYVGVEGGISIDEHGASAFAWVVVQNGELTGQARTASFDLPPSIVSLIREGKELGEADDIVFGETNSKQKGGAVGLLTKGVSDRATLYAEAVVLALIPFINRDLYETDARARGAKVL